MNLKEIEIIDSDLDRAMIKGYDEDKEFNRLYKDIVLKRVTASSGFTNPSEANIFVIDKNMPDFQKAYFCDLDKNKPLFDYFITCAFPTNHEFTMKYLDIGSQYTKWKIGPKKFRECTPDEQHSFISRLLMKHISLIADKYHIFYEQHLTGDLHFHGRIKTPEKMNMKTLKTFIHRIFELPLKYNHFCDIKEYNHDRWNQYHEKYLKTEQTTEYAHFKNI